MALALGGFRVIALSLSGKFGQIEVLRKYGTQYASSFGCREYVDMKMVLLFLRSHENGLVHLRSDAK